MSRRGLVSRRSGISTAAPRTTTFEPQDQETYLGQNAFNDLETIRRQRADKTSALSTSLKRALELLNEVVAEVGDRASEERTRHQVREQKRRRDGGEEAEDPTRKEEYEAFQTKCERLIKDMDLSVRKVIDNQGWAEEVPDNVNQIINKSQDAAQQAGVDENGQIVRQNEGDGGEELQGVMPQDSVDSHSVQPLKPVLDIAPTAVLHAAQTHKASVYDSQSLSEKYSQNAAYRSFYELKWDATHEEENPPPLPHHSLWFALEEGRPNTTSQRARKQNTQSQSQPQSMPGAFDQENSEIEMLVNEAQDDEDTELQVAAENVRTRCPLTTQFFREPVSSKKCPHSFEKAAIHEFINNSSDRLPLSSGTIAEINEAHPGTGRDVQRLRSQATVLAQLKQPKVARCPECDKQLGITDLRDNPFLARKARQAEEAEKKSQTQAYGDDEDDDDEEDVVGTQRRRVYAVGSSPAPGGRRSILVKGEPLRQVSIVPNSQIGAGNGGGGPRRGVEDLSEHEE